MNRSRKGSLLIETIVGVAVSSAMILTAVTLLHQTMSWSKVNKSRSDQVRTVEHLASQWRLDAHSAESVEVNGDDGVTFVFRDSREVVYKKTEESLIREERKMGISQSGELKCREVFRLEIGRVKFEKLDAPNRAKISISHQPAGTNEERFDLVVESVVSKWKMQGAKR
jgi:hypothetical protein